MLGQRKTKNILAFGLDMSVFTNRLKEARKRAGISQEKLGVLAGIDEASASARVNQYERGKHEPDITMVARLAAALNVPVAMLYAESDDEVELLQLFHSLSLDSRTQILGLARKLAGENESGATIRTRV